jgi:hypothetical protein
VAAALPCDLHENGITATATSIPDHYARSAFIFL